MDQQMGDLAPQLEFRLHVRKATRTDFLGVPPRKQSQYLGTPTTIRSVIYGSPRHQFGKQTPKSSLLSPTARGSPMVTDGRNQCQSPNKLSPFHMSPSILKGQSPSKYSGDRFIPNRSKMDVNQSNFVLLNPNPRTGTSPFENQQTTKIRVLTFGNESPKCLTPKETTQNVGQMKTPRLEEITYPEQVLDAPGLITDLGVYPLDWSVNNLVALALDTKVYLWNSKTSKTEILCKCSPNSFITTIKWNECGNVLAVACGNGKINCWLYDSGKVIVIPREWRVTSLAWNKNILSCGDVLGQIRHFDVTSSGELEAKTIKAHSSEVISLAWNRNGEILASGCQGEIKIWSGKCSKPLLVVDGQLTLTVCLWCPWLNSVYALGTCKGSLQIWRVTETATKLSNTDSGSAITDVKWFPPGKGIFSSHENGDVNYWTFPLMKNIKRFKGHGGSVFYLALAPDFSVLLSLGEDESLRFWNISWTENNPIRSPMSTLNQLR